MIDTASQSLSIVIPAKDEKDVIGAVVAKARRLFPNAEVIVVDDGSADNTAQIAQDAGARVIRHPQCLGNGAAVKAGARAAVGATLAFMDGDGQHDAEDLVPLIEALDRGYGMVVGSRLSSGHANAGRFVANGFYNKFASFITGHRILDLTSGFRVARAHLFSQFLYLLPNGFSYPTTSTMAFLRSGYPVGFVQIAARKRVGKSHIRPLKDGLRFSVIIFKIATLYAPLKVFLPASMAFFMAGLVNYIYTYITMERFTNMSLLMFSASVIVFLIGLISEQITALMYSKT
jgi:glycosyltransferase involved in cell wall biosynthesis